MSAQKIFTVALDAGHGLYTAGKRCLRSIDPGETREWTLNNCIVIKVMAKLALYPVKIIRVDDVSGKTDRELSERVKAANNGRADIYLSIHHNAGINGGQGGGVTVHSYMDGKVAVDPVAKSLYECVVSRNGLKGNRSVTCLKNDFYVLNHTSMKALLLENGFMDSAIDTPIILTDQHAEKTADGIMAFILNMAGISPEKQIENPAENPPDQPTVQADESVSKTIYRVQTGAFSRRVNAESLVKKLAAAGFEAFVVEE